MDHGYDDLSYSRSFSNPNTSKVTNTTENNKIIEVSFDSIGEQKIKLTVKDKFGKISEIEKILNVQSTLRPEIFMAPKATTR
jgi:hypothetical protein